MAADVDATQIRARRYFPAFITACKAMALLRSYQGDREKEIARSRKIVVDFADFAITRTIFEPVFEESLHRGSDENYATRSTLEHLVEQNHGQPIDAEILCGVDELTEVDGLADKAVCAKVVTGHDVLFLFARR